jgi:hypothetical protein
MLLRWSEDVEYITVMQYTNEAKGSYKVVKCYKYIHIQYINCGPLLQYTV